MIDMHCHILPGLDDGAAELDDSLGIARQLVQAGFKQVIATPHVLEGRDALHPEQILLATERLNQTLRSEGIALDVVPGAEVLMFPDLPQWLREGKILTLGQRGKHLLMELPALDIPLYAEEVFFHVQVLGITPILAHPERNMILGEHLERLVDWMNKGILVQLDLRSLSGRYGPEARTTAVRLVQSGLISCVGTDAHGAIRSAHPYEGELELLKGLLGSERFDQVMASNAQTILEGWPLESGEEYILTEIRPGTWKERMKNFWKVKR